MNKIKLFVREWAATNVVAPYLKVDPGRIRKKSSIDIGGNYPASRSYLVRQPSSNRAGAGADLKARPPPADPHTADSSDCARVKTLLQ
jgi:hypothetical protein